MVDLFFCGVLLLSLEVELGQRIKSQELFSQFEIFCSGSHSIPYGRLTGPLAPK
jgi:hypothetical protein